MVLIPPVLASAIKSEPFYSIMDLDPVVYWPMDDASGVLVNYGSLASKNAAVFGTPVYDFASIVPRFQGGCVDFDGTTDYFQVTDAAITGTNPEFSFGCWISTTTNTGEHTVFQQQDPTSAYCGFRLYTSDQRLRFQSHHTDGTSQIVQTYSLPAIASGQPFYVGVTADDVFFRLYINGVQYMATERTTQTYVSGSDIFIGRAEGSYRYWDGQISNLFMVDYAMTADQHESIWRKGQLNIERPLGDHFKDHPLLIADGPVLSSTSVGASSDPTNDPVWNYNNSLSIARNVWFKFVPPSFTDRYRLVLDSSYGTATTLYVYIGPDDLEAPIWNDYESKGSILNEPAVGYEYLNENPNNTVVAGQAYYISAGVQRGELFNLGPFDLSVENFPPAAANDDFADAITINVASAGSVSGSTINATIENKDEALSTNCAQYTVWYKFVSDTTGTITLDTCNGILGEGHYYGVAVWDGTGIVTVADLNWSSPLAADYYSGNGYNGCGEITIAVTSGTTYYVQVSQENVWADADFVLSWSDIT